ncbi:MAG: Cna B-type domain-containing protein [Erysipelotrichaceae bacterium]|nr:Cna B-type domain-containing protein [Erysipelotrichaceae bacterium]
MKKSKLLVILLSIFMVLTVMSVRSYAAASDTKTDIQITKVWDDNDNEDKTRPDSITVYLKNGNNTVQTITIKDDGNGNWKGKFKDVPCYDNDGKVITYTVEEKPIPDYEGTVAEGKIEYVYEYPTNVYTKEVDLSPVGAETVDVTNGNGSWKINQGVNADYITASGFKFNDLIIADCVFTEYDGNGKKVTGDDCVFKIEENTQSGNLNNGGVWYYPDVANIASYEGEINTDHYFTMKFKDGVTLLTEDHYGETADVTMTVTNLTLLKDNYGTQAWTAGRTKMRLFLNNGTILETGPGTDRASLGGIVIDINVQIEGVTSGNMVLPIVDIDTVNDLGPADDPRPESVWLGNSFQKTIYTIPLASTNPTKVDCTGFEVRNNQLRAYALGPDQDTFKSGFVAVAKLDSNGFDITWKGSTCSTAMFGEIVPFKMKCTVDESITEHVGGTIAEQGDWRSRAYGEAKLIACTPDENYHIRYIHIDGKNIDLNGFDANGVQTVTTGWTQDINQGTETVTLYQRANGVVEIYLPHQYYAVNNAEPSGRTDHWLDVSYETNGVVGSYTITNKQTTDYIQLSGTKTWYDTVQEHNNEDEVTLILYQIDENGTEQIVNATPEWDGDTYTFYKLVATDAQGHTYTYRVEEVPINGYRTIYDGDSNENITNIALDDVDVTKIWDDNDDENQVRPVSIEVTLYRDGEVPEDMEDAVVELNEENGWYYCWEDLSLYDDEGHEYVWTVEEENIPNYEAAYASNGTHLEITNTYVPVPVTGDSYTSFYIGSAMTVIGLMGMIFTIMKFRLVSRY